MKFLLSFLLLLAASAFGAVPSYTVFRGTGGILITSNPPTGNITFDGSGIFTSSGTNATLAISTNGVLVIVAATNINFITGSNVFLAATNIGSRAHIGINAFTPVPFIEGAVTNLLLTWILPILTVDSLTVSNLLAAPPLSSVQYNSNGITRGSAGFIYTNGQVRVADIVVAGQGLEVTAGSLVLNGGATALAAWTDLGNIRWPGSGVVRFEDQFSLNMNRIQLGGDTAAFPAIGRTNGDVIILGANGAFKRGGSTNRLIVPAVIIANDGAVGTPLLTLENPLSSITWDVAIDSNPDTYFLRLGRVGDADYTMVWELGGNVGIGTTNPATRLDVNGRFRANTNVYFPGLLSNALPVAFLAVDSGGEVYETAIPTVGSSPETNAVLTNLIGTVARNVTNVISLSTSNATSNPLTNSYTAGVLTLFGLEAGANVTVTPNGSNLVIAATGGGGGGGAGSLAVNDNQFVTNSLLNFKDGALTTNLNVKATSGSATALTVDTNVLVVTGGKVGFGTASPAQKLHLAGSGATYFEIQDTSGGTGYLGASGIGFDIQTVGVPIRFLPSGNEAVRIDLFGNVSIGTNSPAARLTAIADNSVLNVIQFGTTNKPSLLLMDTNGNTTIGYHGGRIVLTNSDIAIGKVWTATNLLGGGTWSNAPAGGAAISGHSNAIPFINGAGNAFTYIESDGGFGSLTNPGFGFNPITSGGPQAGYGGLMVFANHSMGLVTIGHPNPGSDFATFTTALVVSNRYNSAADFKNDMVKIDAVMIGGGLRSDSTMTRWRVWNGTTSSNDVAELTIGGVLTLAGGLPTNNAAFTITTNNFALDTYYTNMAQRSWVSASIGMTNVLLTEKAWVGLYLDQDGDGTWERTGINVRLQGISALAGVEQLGAFLQPSARFIFTNLGTVANSSIEPNSSQWVRQ